MRLPVVAFLTLLLLTTPLAAQKPALNTLTQVEQAAGWRLLFDGKTTAGWRGFKVDTLPSGWKAVDGALTRVAQAADIITKDQFANYELTLEWNIAEGGNSGIMYRVTEADSQTYWTGPEFQVLDDDRHPDGKQRLTAAGSCYALYPAPPGVVRPAGEWNRVRLIVNRNHVEHWLNGVKVVEYEIGSPDWEWLVANSKFGAHAGFGRAKIGHIALQEHGERVAYRNIKIREIK